MGMGFVADGCDRLKASAEYQASLRQLRQKIVERYAAELAAASWIQRRYLYWRIDREYRAELRRLAPSAYTLF